MNCVISHFGRPTINLPAAAAGIPSAPDPHPNSNNNHNNNNHVCQQELHISFVRKQLIFPFFSSFVVGFHPFWYLLRRSRDFYPPPPPRKTWIRQRKWKLIIIKQVFLPFIQHPKFIGATRPLQHPAFIPLLLVQSRSQQVNFCYFYHIFDDIFVFFVLYKT